LPGALFYSNFDNRNLRLIPQVVNSVYYLLGSSDEEIMNKELEDI